MHRNGLPDDAPGWAVMDARPLCFGSVKDGLERGEIARGCRDEFQCRGCLFEGSQLAPTCYELNAALLRVYARENHELRIWRDHHKREHFHAVDALVRCIEENKELRSRVDALEWLVEVENIERDKDWWDRRYVRIGRKRYDLLISEYIDSFAHAHKEAGI